MNEPVWLDVEILIDLHAEQLALFGGPDGIRDQGMLESALGRPLNKFTYGETDLAALAAGEVDEDGLTRWIRDNWPSE